MPFSPRLAGECRDRTRNADGSPRTDLPGMAPALPVLSDDDARWYFSMEPDAAAASADELAELDAQHAAEWDAYCRTLLRPSGLDTAKNVGARWWCACGAFASGQTSLCVKCRSWGPHVWSEDNPCTGNAVRRARLRREHAKRRSIRS